MLTGAGQGRCWSRRGRVRGEGAGVVLQRLGVHERRPGVADKVGVVVAIGSSCYGRPVRSCWATKARKGGSLGMDKAHRGCWGRGGGVAGVLRLGGARRRDVRPSADTPWRKQRVVAITEVEGGSHQGEGVPWCLFRGRARSLLRRGEGGGLGWRPWRSRRRDGERRRLRRRALPALPRRRGCHTALTASRRLTPPRGAVGVARDELGRGCGGGLGVAVAE